MIETSPWRVVVAVSLAALIAACGGDDGGGDGDGDAGADAPSGAEGWSTMPSLPVAVANNAVASVRVGGDCTVFSVLGIGGGFTSADITSAAYRWRVGDAGWETIDDAPGPPRVAANAVGVAGNLYVLGGYTVSGAGAEASSNRLDRFNLTTNQWEPMAPIPTPIDDTVAVAWLDRYIVVVSGWSNTANVDAVQIYDTQGDLWTPGTAFPGTPAFGHAGGIDGNNLVIIDGAASTAGFPIVNQAWSGALDPDNLGTIAWTDLGAHVGPPRYRAAGGQLGEGVVFFHAGTSTPYNFDGLRYDNNQPAAPLATTLVAAPNLFELAAPNLPTATMDHRSLAFCDEGEVYSVGGMVAGPEATTEVWRFLGGGDS